jgi:hypothetical protein
VCGRQAGTTWKASECTGQTDRYGGDARRWRKAVLARTRARVRAVRCMELTSSDTSKHVREGVGQMRRHTAWSKLVMCAR